MYVPVWQGLNPTLLFQSPGKALPFPLNVPEATYSYVARSLIYHLFAGLHLRPDDTVLVPDYHHSNEILAMRAAGASLRFYPVRKNFEIDLDALARLCRTGKPRVLFIIHYMGWPQPMKDLLALCRKHNMILVEDCALAMLSETGGQPLGTFGDYGIFCLYKTLPVPNGGVLVQNRQPLENVAKLTMRPPSLLSTAGRTSELTFEWFRGRHERAGQALFDLKRGVGRALSALRVARTPVGNTGFDLGNTQVGMSPVCHDLLKRFDYVNIKRKRRENFLFLRDRLAGKVALLRLNLNWGVCPLFFPLLVADKHAAAVALRERGIESMEFWNVGDPEARSSGSPTAQFLREHLLELPIHQDLSLEHMDYVADQVQRLKVALPPERHAA